MSDGTYDFVVVANRLPVDALTAEDGTVTWRRSPGGLVSALEPALRGRPAAWVGWSGRFSDDPDVSPLPAGDDQLALIELPQSREEVELYYEGMCNATIWPLYHDAVATPTYHRHLWTAYRDVNRRFAEAAAQIAAPGATVWVHDYQLQLVPRLLRDLRPDLRIGFFLHIPFPPIELFMQLPWRADIISGLLGADLVGFQIPDDAVNFIALAARLCDAMIDGADIVVQSDETPPELSAPTRRVRAADFPISIDFAAIDELARSDRVQARAKEIRAEVGNPVTLVLGVDRLDYTKGIGVRLTAIDELLEDGSLDPGSVVFFQIATPSRGNIEEYQRIRDEIELAVGRAVGLYGSVGANPIQYLHQSLDTEELIAFYQAADIMLVTPLRDGMNLVCKEYVAARTDGDGALVLSEFTGAAFELTQAWLVNPYDPDGVKGAILAAVHATPEDRRRRMAAMRAQVEEHDVQRWARDFLEALTH